MKRSRHTKRALAASVLSMVLCVAVLLGTTLAWFTDSVTNTGNKITAGNLQVSLLQKTDTLSDAQKQEGLPAVGDYTDISDSETAVFDGGLWEPGYSKGATLKVSNTGNLALKYELSFKNIQTTTGVTNNPANTEATGNIAEVLDVYVLDTYRAPQDTDTPVGTLQSFIADGSKVFESGILAAGTSSGDLNVVVKMQDSAGNLYQDASASFDVELRAVQAPLEENGFDDNTYDAAATGDPDHSDWGTITIGKVTVPVNKNGDTILKDAEGVTTFVVPYEAVDENAETLTLNIELADQVEDGVPVGEDQTAKTYDITIDGLKEGNTEPITVSFFIGKGLSNVTIYHYNQKLDDANYDPQTGIVTFTSTSFSPFTIVYDKALSVTTEEEFLRALSVDGMTVKLQNDLTISTADVVVPEGVTVSIDLGGNTLTVNRNSALINRGTITSLTNGNFVGGKNYGIYNYGTIDLLNVNVKSTASSSMGAIYNNGHIGEISGGRYLGHSDSPYANSITGSCGLYNTGSGVVDLISGGYFQGSSVAFRSYNKEGIKSVTGGFFDCPYMDANNRTFCDSTTIDEVFYNNAPLSVTGGTWYNVGTKINSKIPEGYVLTKGDVCEMTSGKKYVKYNAETGEAAHWVEDSEGTTYYYYTVEKQG
ncbi:SipW-dependent-type signal peptide-containing protein [uncultured Ruthenibacterium sp.]|uniref:SipW-dependent-type signal peptide-containing protein n=1 Tax=uncultured Ruthenibacterium sp. TaxID=1905347 RepID=UPI00349E9D0B